MLGWYVARRRGPGRLRAFDPGRSRTPYVDNTDVVLRIACVLHSQPPDGLGLVPWGRKLGDLLEWATTSDDAGLVVNADLHDDVQTLATEAGLLDVVNVPQGGYHVFKDLTTGNLIRTWREDPDGS